MTQNGEEPNDQEDTEQLKTHKETQTELHKGQNHDIFFLFS